MYNKYAFLNEACDKILLYYTRGEYFYWFDSTINKIVKHKNPPHDLVVSEGFVPVVGIEYDETTQKLGEDIVDGDSVHVEVIDKSPTEKDSYWSAKRLSIEDKIYAICKARNEIITTRYADIEQARFTEDREAIRASDWAYFDARSGNVLTCRQYAESRVTDKIEAGDNLLNQNIAKRTDLCLVLASTSNEELDSFDYITTWNELDDYVVPVNLEIRPTFLQMLKNILNHKIM
ncbi:hypothetical protein KAR91_56475 [Candidatus Pacearchaeota archaeon]|nr:hypothetical protein [Candidatus Pacearchaeota archaeon]